MNRHDCFSGTPRSVGESSLLHAGLLLLVLLLSLPQRGHAEMAGVGLGEAQETRDSASMQRLAQPSILSSNASAPSSVHLPTQSDDTTARGTDSRTAYWHPVDSNILQGVRGGFDIGGGISIAFGLTRTVSINGQLIVSTSIQIPDVSQLTSAQSAALATQLGSVHIVRNGTLSNTADTLRLGATSATIVQNSLDNQSIKSQTTINATVGSLSVLKSINTQAAVRDAVINAIGSR